jgi:hypothetical protein
MKKIKVSFCRMGGYIYSEGAGSWKLDFNEFERI